MEPEAGEEAWQAHGTLWAVEPSMHLGIPVTKTLPRSCEGRNLGLPSQNIWLPVLRTR